MNVQSLWVGSKLSRVEIACINSFISNGYSYDLYIYENLPDVPHGVNIKDANSIVNSSEIQKQTIGSGKGSLGGFSDKFRWSLLHKRGGTWVDIDMICLKPFDIPKKCVAGELGPHDGSVASTQLLSFQISDKFIKDVYNKMCSINYVNGKFGVIGPGFLRKQIKYYNQEGIILDYRVTNSIPWKKWRTLISSKPQDVNFVNNMIQHDDVFFLHIWNEKWRHANIDKNKPFHKNSFMEKIIQKYT